MSARPSPSDPANDDVHRVSPDGRARRWIVWRQDDNGNRFEVARYESREQAEQVAATMEARGHKQIYWVAEKSAPS